MERREFVTTASCLVFGAGTGCLTAEESGPRPEIALLELENHRPSEGCEFTVQITDRDQSIFEKTRRLGPVGSGNDAAAFEEPVSEPGAYSVRVDADDYTATADTQDLISDGKSCLGLRFYLGRSTLHMEHHLYDRCE